MTLLILKIPFSKDAALKGFKDKLHDRSLKMLLESTSFKEPKVLVKTALQNGFDGFVFKNVGSVQDVFDINKVVQIMQKLPHPYRLAHWEFYVSVSIDSNITDDQIMLMVPQVTGVINNGKFSRYNTVHKDNHVSYHSSDLNDICDDMSDEILDLYRRGPAGPEQPSATFQTGRL